MTQWRSSLLRIAGWWVMAGLYFIEEAPQGSRRLWILGLILSVTWVYGMKDKLLSRQVYGDGAIVFLTILLEGQSARLFSPLAHLLHLYHLATFAQEESRIHSGTSLFLYTTGALFKFPLAWWYGVAFPLGEMPLFFLILQLFISLGVWLLEKYRREKGTVALLYERLREEVGHREKLALTRERERLSRSLHDTLGHRLTEVLMRLELTELEHPHLDEAKATLRQGLFELQAVVRDLHRIEPVEKMLRRVEEMGFTADLILEADETFLSCQSVKTVVREAVTNFLKHSSGSRIEVRLLEKEDILYLRILDDGQVKTPPILGRGLEGLKAWVQEEEGTFLLDTDQGFCLTIGLTKEALCHELGVM